MKRPLQLPLAIALALSGTDALALGLGAIHVNSKLNQPLDAEIPILQGTAGEAEGLLVQMADSEDFDRVGLNRSRLTVPLEFSIVKSGKGELVIKVTSKEIVREPFIDFLVEANWPKGRLLREYTVLLDPPVMAPATGSAVTAAAKAPERAPTQTLPESKPKPAPAKPKSAPVASAPRSEEAPSKPAAPPSAPKRAAGDSEYTVEAGDTLSGIARTVRGDESTNVNQLMLALLKQNPNAFYQNNINALKRGSILRIPSAGDVKAVGSASEAAAEVRTQIEDWRGGAAAKPTLVADTGAKPEETKAPTPAPKTPTSSTATTPTAKATTGSERLELVPPKAGKGSVAMADRPGSGAGSASASTDLKGELARTKEALTSREQEAGELKSRVKELEETKGKTDRLISLKDSEIADLQRKLRELQDPSKAGAKTTATTAAAAPSATTPATPAATTPPATPAAGSGASTKADTVSKEDIWGNATATADAKTAAAAKTPAGTSTPPSATTTPPATPATTTGATTPPATPSSTTGATTPPTVASATTPPVTPPASTASSSSPTPATPILPGPTVGAGGSADTTTPASATTPAAKPAASTMPVKDTKTRMAPLGPTAPAWYEQSWVKPAAIGGGALLVLLGLLGLRKRKADATASERGSIAGAFGDSPLKPSDNGAFAAVPMDSEEDSLRDQLRHDPGNVGLHLELLSLLYAERNVIAFEDAADAMHVHVYDPNQPEWLEAKAMGQELAPSNPLFADDAPAHDGFDEAVTAPHATTVHAFDDDDVDDVFNHQPPVAHATPRANTPVFDFDLDTDAPLAPLPAAPASEAPFAFDDLPPLDFGKEPRQDLDGTPAPAPLSIDEDEFPGEDGVGTKLDLAKAYLDMGDPEGARSMLEEVLAEGNDAQKGEARRLMGEIR